MCTEISEMFSRNVVDYVYSPPHSGRAPYPDPLRETFLSFVILATLQTV